MSGAEREGRSVGGGGGADSGVRRSLGDECLNCGGGLCVGGVRGGGLLASGSSCTESLDAVLPFWAPRCKIIPPYLPFFSACAAERYLFWLVLGSPQDRRRPDSAR